MSYIPIHEAFGTLNEQTGQRYFQCPVSGQNTYDWGIDFKDYPEELILREYAQAEAPIFIKPCYYSIYEVWLQLREEDDSCSEDFLDFFKTKLPESEDYFIIVVNDPENIMGEYETYMYKGKITN
jgi:hypothetical protein